MSDIAKTRIACNLCRRQKIRCDRAKPACENCRDAGVDCVFTPIPRRKKPREQLEENLAYTRQLEESLRSLHRRENDAFPSPIPGLFDSSGFETSLTAFLWHLQYCTPGVTLNAQLASIFDFNDFAHQLASSRLPGEEARSTNYALPQWPTRYVVEQVIGHFATSQLYTIFPILDLESLPSLNSLDPDAGIMNAGDRACLVAFTAFITRIEHHELAFLHPTPDSYLQAALSLVPQLIMEHTNIRALQALLIMSLYIAPLGQPQTAQLLLSMAIRILYNLGGHTIHSSLDSLSPNARRQHEHLRSLFWLCYSIDKEMSLRKCQAPLIHDADCILDLPASYKSAPSLQPFFTDQQQSPRQVLFPSDLRLSLFKSKVYQQLYSQPSLQASVTTRLRIIRELDHELHELKAQFPASYQPETVFETGTSLGLSDASARGLNIRAVTVHLEYYHCLTKIHGASLVGHDVTEESSAPSSLELCYQAARSTLLYLSRMPFLINEETFWIYAQFLLTAVLALHYRLITRRRDTSYPHEDLSILKSTLDIFVQMKNKNAESSSRPFAPFMITEAFIRYLINLSCSFNA